MIQSGHGMRDGRTDGRTDGRSETSIPPQQLRCAGGIITWVKTNRVSSRAHAGKYAQCFALLSRGSAPDIHTHVAWAHFTATRIIWRLPKGPVEELMKLMQFSFTDFPFAVLWSTYVVYCIIDCITRYYELTKCLSIHDLQIMFVKQRPVTHNRCHG